MKLAPDDPTNQQAGLRSESTLLVDLTAVFTGLEMLSFFRFVSNHFKTRKLGHLGGAVGEASGSRFQLRL